MATSARIVPWVRGVHWLGEGWKLFRVAPLAWIALVLTYWVLMTMVSLVPIVGIAAASVLVPPFSVGFMALSRAAAMRAPVTLPLLFSGFREHLGSQLTLGGVYLVCLALLLAATALADGGALARWMLTAERPDATILRSEAFLGALATAAALYLPAMMAFWFAPVLAAWHGVGAGKALFFSVVACLMNWRAFLAYGAVVALMTVVVPMLALNALLSASGGALGTQAVSIAFLLIPVMLPTLLASFYVSYRDVFGTPVGA